jgi:hypothetical protein|tara:strand:- start:279 stop:476 length:198 start_codon:yes stop_codon:yes gene_type:complete
MTDIKVLSDDVELNCFKTGCSVIWSDNLKVFLIEMFGHEIRTKSNFKQVHYEAWTPTALDKEPPF